MIHESRFASKTVRNELNGRASEVLVNAGRRFCSTSRLFHFMLPKYH